MFSLVLLFLISRLSFLSRLPIFNDEGIYLRWGQDFIEYFGRGISPVSIDGKQAALPFFLGLIQLFPFDPLILARVMSVTFSLITFITVRAIFQKLFPKSSLYPLSLLMIFCPYLLFFDRLMTGESIMTAVFSLSLLITLTILENPKTRKAIFLGIVTGAGWWFKSTVILIIPAVFLVFFIQAINKRAKVLRLLWLNFIFLFSFLALILPLLLNPGYWRWPFEEGHRLVSFKEMIRFPLSLWLSNLRSATLLLFAHTTPAVFLLFIWGVISGLQKRKIIIPLIFFAVPLLSEIIFFKGFDSRYLVIILPAYLLITAFGLETLPHRWFKASFAGIFAVSVFMSSVLIVSPLRYYSTYLSYFPPIRGDFSQYVVGWPSGYGVKETVDWLKASAKEKTLVVFLRLNSGNPDDALLVYLRKEKNIKVVPVRYLGSVIKQIKESKIPDVEFYYVSRGNQLSGLENRLTEKIRFKKPLDSEYVGIYLVKI